MVIALKDQGLECETQVQLRVHFRDKAVGFYIAGMIVEGKVLVEYKVVNQILTEHKSQVINYLKATGIDVGLLVNFGKSRVEYKRFTKQVSDC